MSERPRPPFWALLAGTLALSAALALVANFFVAPALRTRQAQEQLKQIQGEIAPPRALNTEMLPYKGAKISGVNTEQKALGRGGKATNPPAIELGNGKKFRGNTVDVYLDFSSQPSRDALLLNRGAITAMVSSGKIQLRVHPVPRGDALSLYSFEALAEAAATAPRQAWPLLQELLKNAMAQQGVKDKEKLVSSVVKAAGESSVPSVDAASVKNGTFASWIVGGAQDERLKNGFYAPMFYVNGQAVDAKTRNLNDSGEFQKIMEGK